MSKFQSVYRKFHSCETALLLAQNNIFVSLNAGCSNGILNFSAACYTIDYNFFNTYNTGMVFYQLLLICFFHSSLVDLKFLLLQSQIATYNLFENGVPQGSVLTLLGLLYSLHTT